MPPFIEGRLMLFSLFAKIYVIRLSNALMSYLVMISSY